MVDKKSKSAGKNQIKQNSSVEVIKIKGIQNGRHGIAKRMKKERRKERKQKEGDKMKITIFCKREPNLNNYSPNQH
jgi:hypothetical protein